MARRVVMGRMPDGTFDLRISRRGIDALSADVNDSRQISFSAQRAARAKVGAAGQISSLNTWVSFGKTFADPPPTLAAVKINGRVIFNHYEYLPHPTEANAVFHGTPYCLVVQATRVKAIQAVSWGNHAFASGDKYLFYTLSQD